MVPRGVRDSVRSWYPRLVWDSVRLGCRSSLSFCQLRKAVRCRIILRDWFDNLFKLFWFEILSVSDMSSSERSYGRCRYVRQRRLEYLDTDRIWRRDEGLQERNERRKGGHGLHPEGRPHSHGDHDLVSLDITNVDNLRLYQVRLSAQLIISNGAVPYRNHEVLFEPHYITFNFSRFFIFPSGHWNLQDKRHTLNFLDDTYIEYLPSLQNIDLQYCLLA